MPVQFVDASTMPRAPLRMLLYGNPRLGKTTSAASAPRPAFLSVGLEGGDMTLRAFHGVKTTRIQTSQGMLDAIEQIRQNPTLYDTVVVDSVTFYADLVIAELVAKNRGPMRLQDWGILDNHLSKMVLPRLHQLPQHIIWIALEQVEKDDATGAVGRIGPMLPGKLSLKLPAVTDMIIRMAPQPVKFADGVIRETHVFQTVPQRTPQGPILAGGRFGQVFPEGWILPTWDALMERIGAFVEVTGTRPINQQAYSQPR